MIDYKRLILIYVIIFFMVILETSFFPNLITTKPDLVVMFVVMIGLYNGLYEGLFFGVSAGIIVGVFSSCYCGIFCAAYGVAGFSAGLIRERVYSDNMLVPVCLSVVISLLTEMLLLCCGYLFGYLKNLDTVRIYIFHLLILNIIFAAPIGFLVRSKYIFNKKTIE